MNNNTEGTKRLYAIRIGDRDGGHPNYIGPLDLAEAEDLAERLRTHRHTFEKAMLYTEDELSGLWRTDK